MSDAIYKGEALVKRWGDSSNALRTVTLQLEEDAPLGRHPFYGFEGARVMIVVMPIGNDQQPVKVEKKKSLGEASGKSQTGSRPGTDKQCTAGTRLGERRNAQSPASDVKSVDSEVSVSPSPAKPRRPFDTLPASQQAALRCQDQEFGRFLRDALVYKDTGTTNAADCVRTFCGVASRADLDGNPAASPGAIAWRALDRRFQSWLSTQRAQELADQHGRH